MDVCMVVITYYSRLGINRYGCHSCSCGQVNREIMYSLSMFECFELPTRHGDELSVLRLCWSRDHAGAATRIKKATVAPYLLYLHLLLDGLLSHSLLQPLGLHLLRLFHLRVELFPLPRRLVCEPVSCFISVCIVSPFSRVWININRVWLPTLLVLRWEGKMFFSLSPFAPRNLVSRNGFGRPVPRQALILHTQAESSIINHQSSIWCLLTGFLPLSAKAFIYIVNRHWVSS